MRARARANIAKKTKSKRKRDMKRTSERDDYLTTNDVGDDEYESRENFFSDQV